MATLGELRAELEEVQRQMKQVTMEWSRLLPADRWNNTPEHQHYKALYAPLEQRKNQLYREIAEINYNTLKEKCENNEVIQCWDDDEVHLIKTVYDLIVLFDDIGFDDIHVIDDGIRLAHYRND